VGNLGQPPFNPSIIYKEAPVLTGAYFPTPSNPFKVGRIDSIPHYAGTKNALKKDMQKKHPRMIDHRNKVSVKMPSVEASVVQLGRNCAAPDVIPVAV
jgi:hypothetical protein